jgi:hypothetical protein
MGHRSILDPLVEVFVVAETAGEAAEATFRLIETSSALLRNHDEHHDDGDGDGDGDGDSDGDGDGDEDAKGGLSRAPAMAHAATSPLPAAMAAMPKAVLLSQRAWADQIWKFGEHVQSAYNSLASSSGVSLRTHCIDRGVDSFGISSPPCLEGRMGELASCTEKIYPRYAC